MSACDEVGGEPIPGARTATCQQVEGETVLRKSRQRKELARSPIEERWKRSL